jgi:hypothetical protein
MVKKRHQASLSEIFRDVGKKVEQSERETDVKGRKSFSIDKNVIEDLETLAWYMEKSASEVVEDALKSYMTGNSHLLEKAKEMREAKR